MNLDRFGFKAKSQRHNNWLYATLDLYSNCYGVRYHFEQGGDVAFSPAWIKSETICQCTGLKDSSGTTIYENDYLEIVLHGSGEIWDEAALVEYSRLGFVYTCKGEEQPLHHLEFQIAEGVVEVYIVGNKWG